MNDDDARRERIAGLKDLVDEEPDDVTARFMLATELAKVGEHGAAAVHFATIVAQDPDYTAAYRGLGRTKIALGDLDGARQVFTAGLVVADRTGDLQSGKEMASFLRRYVEGGGSET